MLDSRNLRCFISVYEMNGFARAAKTLNVTQSSVSARIRNLEDELGGPLFLRLHRSIVPTAKGEKLYRYAKAAIGSADRFVRTMQEDEAA